MTPIRRALGAGTVNPELLTSAERLQYEGFLRREEMNAAVQAAGEGSGADQADRPADRLQPADRPAHSPRRARRCLPRPRELARALARPARRSLVRRMPQRRRALAPSPPSRGFGGSLRVVTEWATRRRRAEAAAGFRPSEMPLRPEDRNDADPEAGASHQGGRSDRGDHRGRRSPSSPPPATSSSVFRR